MRTYNRILLIQLLSFKFPFMEHHEYINLIINGSHKEKLIDLFDINNAESIERVQKADLSLVAMPFSSLLTDYRNFINSLNILKRLIECIQKFSEKNNSYCICNGATKQIIKICLYMLDTDKTKDNINMLKISLFELFKTIYKFNNKLSVYVCNILCMLYIDSADYRFADDILTMVKPETKNNDYYIYLYYTGLVYIFKENIKDGFHYINEAANLKILQPYIKYDIDLLNLLGINIKEPINKLQYIVKNGLLDQINEYMPYSIDVGITRIMRIYLPLICFRNVLLNIYADTSKNSRLDIKNIQNILNCDINVIYCKILVCIDKGLIRGYLSINKDTLVLSKINPFPDILK